MIRLNSADIDVKSYHQSRGRLRWSTFGKLLAKEADKQIATRQDTGLTNFIHVSADQKQHTKDITSDHKSAMLWQWALTGFE
jgi:hypothetical protein